MKACLHFNSERMRVYREAIRRVVVFGERMRGVLRSNAERNLSHETIGGKEFNLKLPTYCT